MPPCYASMGQIVKIYLGHYTSKRRRRLKTAQMRGGARRQQVRRTLCTLNLLPRAPTKQMGCFQPPASPTSAVRGGQGHSFRHLGEKSPLHFGGSGDRRGHSEALGEFEAEAVEENGLRGVRAHDAAQAELVAVLGRQHDVGALDALELGEDRARTLPETRATLPLLQRLPQHISE